MTEIFYNEIQFYILFNLLLWMFIFYLGYKKNIVSLFYIQFIVMLPMVLQLIHSSYIQGIPFGYALSFGLLLTSSYYAFMSLKTRKKKD